MKTHSKCADTSNPRTMTFRKLSPILAAKIAGLLILFLLGVDNVSVAAFGGSADISASGQIAAVLSSSSIHFEPTGDPRTEFRCTAAFVGYSICSIRHFFDDYSPIGFDGKFANTNIC